VRTFSRPTFSPVFLPPLFQVFPEAESAVVAEPGVVALVFAAVELSPEVAVLVAEPGVVFVSVVFVAADVAELRASVDIAVVFVVLVPVSVVVVGVYNSGHPRFLAFPNVDCFASSSSSVELAGEGSVHSSIGARTNYRLCSILSTLGLHQNKNLEHSYNNPSPGYNNVSDTNDLPMDATTNHSRKRGLPQCQGRRRHTCQAALSTPAVRQIRWVAADQYSRVYLPLPSLG